MIILIQIKELPLSFFHSLRLLSLNSSPLKELRTKKLFFLLARKPLLPAAPLGRFDPLPKVTLSFGTKMPASCSKPLC